MPILTLSVRKQTMLPTETTYVKFFKKNTVALHFTFDVHRI